MFHTLIVGLGRSGRHGPQKLSTYRSWLEESGFKVTKTITKDPTDIPPDVIPAQAILSAT